MTGASGPAGTAAGTPCPVRRLGIVTGLAAEAQALGPAIRALPPDARPLLFCSGGDVARTAFGVDEMLKDRVEALLSFGIAGGLDPSLRPGDVVIGDRVIAPDGRSLPADQAWADALGGDSCRRGAIAGADRPVVSAEAKRSLRARTGALAVDMESHVIAAAAAAAGIPFLALRAIADPAARALPSAALAGLAPDGRTRPFAVLARLLLRPWQMMGVVRLAGDSASALATLRRVASRDAPRLFRLPAMDLGHEFLDMP